MDNKKDYYVRVNGKILTDKNNKVIWHTETEAFKLADKLTSMGKKANAGFYLF